MLDRRRILRRIILIILAAAAVYLIGNGSVSLWDRDEPRYAQTSRQMLQSGDWVVPRLLDQVRTAKPVFIYWCQAASMKVFGDNAFAARFPSVIGMTATLILLATVLWKAANPRRAMWTVFILATSGLAIASAKICLTDAVLLFFVTTAQLCLCALYLKAKDGSQISDLKSSCFILWPSIALAVLIKGPVVLGVMLMTMLVLAILDWKTIRIRWWRGINPLIGIIIVVIICGPWAYLIHTREPTFFATIIGHDVVNRIMQPLEGHKGPPGYYLMTIWATYFPWSLLLPAAIITGWRNRRIPHVRFALAAVIGPWIMFEIVRTKLPHYLLPVYPALAFLTADMLLRAARKKWFADRVFLRILLIWGGIVIAISLSPWLALLRFHNLPLLALGTMILFPLLAFEYARSVYIHFRATRPLDAAAAMGIGMMIVIAVLHAFYLPNADFLRISIQTADALKKENAMHPGDAIMIDYKEPSLAFYQGGTIRPQRDNKFLENNPESAWSRWIVLTGDLWKQTPQQIKDRLDIISTVNGLSYADGGRIVDVMVVRKRAND